MIRRLRESRFLRNALVLQVGGAMNAGFGILSAVGLAYVLGASDQGSWVVTQQLYGLLFFVVNLGVVQVAVTQVASASARGGGGKVVDWLAFLAKCHLLIGVWLAVGGWFVLPWAVERWRDYNPDVDVRVGLWAWLLTLTPFLELPKGIAVTAFQGTRRMLPLAQVENSGELLRVFLVLAGATVTGSPLGAAVGHLTASAITSGVSLEMYRRAERDGSYALPRLREVLRRVPSVPMRQGLLQGLKFGVMRQTDALAIKILPPLLIQTFNRSEWVAYFRIAQSIMNVPMMLMQGISRTALPALSELKGVKDHARFRRLFGRATVLGGGAVAGGVLLTLPVVPFLVLALPPDYREPIRTLSVILALGYVPLAFMIAMDAFYLLSGRLKVAVGINIVGFLVTQPIVAWLIWAYPRTGPAWGFVLTTSWCVWHYLFAFRTLRRERLLEAT